MYRLRRNCRTMFFFFFLLCMLYKTVLIVRCHYTYIFLAGVIVSSCCYCCSFGWLLANTGEKQQMGSHLRKHWRYSVPTMSSTTNIRRRSPQSIHFAMHTQIHNGYFLFYLFRFASKSLGKTLRARASLKMCACA